jgi:hypothetical protein
MDICVIMNGDGHFEVSDITNRETTLELLASIQDGDYWDNNANDYLDELGIAEENLKTISNEKWLEFVNQFEARGIMEIVTI